MKIGLILFAVSMSASAAAKVDNQGFYATREQQIFKAEDKQDFRGGYVKGDDIQYFHWTGFITGKEVYFEVHGERIRLHIEKKWTVLSLRSAPALPGGDKDSFALDDKGADIYVKSAKNARQSLICVESLGPDIYIHSRPYWEVYLVTDPLGSPHAYRLSGINADCRGIERARNGALLAPTWDINKKVNPGVVINYYAIEKSGLKKTDVRFTGSIESEYADEYIIDGDH
jgi:hypothetical protein